MKLRAIPACIGLVLVFAPAARAESCTSSRDYILSGSFGELPQSPQSYQDLFKMCLETLQLGTVKDAFLLKDGAVVLLSGSVQVPNPVYRKALKAETLVIVPKPPPAVVGPGNVGPKQ